MKTTISSVKNILLMVSAVSASANWGGALVAGNGVSTVTGVVTVPTASVPPNGDPSTRWGGAAWVGIDGTSDTCKGLLQTGVQWNVINGVPSYNAWYEWFPDEGLTHIASLTISPGDVIGMEVVATSNSSGYIYIVNHSTTKSYRENFSRFTDYELCQKYGEWIVEDFKVNGDFVAFADFTPVTFTGCSLTDSTGTHDLSDGYSDNIKQGATTYATCNIADSSTVDCKYGN